MGAVLEEAASARAESHRAIEEYIQWGSKIRIGSVQWMLYDEILEFVNVRVETATAALLLIENGRIADALALCRPLLENYLLLILMCRGRKHFRVQSLDNLSPSQVKQQLGTAKAKLSEAHGRGEETARLDIKIHPRYNKVLMHVFDGLRAEDEPDLIVPAHYFHHQNFDPETLRLDENDYFTYYPSSPASAKARKEHRKEADALYKYFLSYYSLIDNLELNGLVDDASKSRIEAHYTFLGKFIHPSHDAARRLHQHSNQHYGGTAVGLAQPYSEVAVLLASLYVCYCLASIIQEAVELIKAAPCRYIADPATDELDVIVNEIPARFDYFWFLFNDAPLWDRYNHAIHHLSDEDLAAIGHFSAVVNGDSIKFDQDIYGHLESAMTSCHNNRCGHYSSPIRSG